MHIQQSTPTQTFSGGVINAPCSSNVAATLKLSTGQDGPQLDLAPGAHCNSWAVVSLAVQMLVCQTALPASSQLLVSALQPIPCKTMLQVATLLHAKY